MSAICEIDLMSDVALYTPGVKRILTIVQSEDGHFRVIEDGRMADGLIFDEMLGQVVNLLHPLLGRPHYGMLSREELAATKARRRKREEDAKT